MTKNEFYINEEKSNVKGDTQFGDGRLEVTSFGLPAPQGIESDPYYDNRYTPLTCTEFEGTIEIMGVYRTDVAPGLQVKVTGHPEFLRFLSCICYGCLPELVNSPNFSNGVYTGKIEFYQVGFQALVKNVDETFVDAK